jgi:4-hydroxy-tetrahydrodipicolinate reductase
VIDFTSPAATVAFAELAAQARAVHVIGTTGLEPAIWRKSRPPPATPRSSAPAI